MIFSETQIGGTYVIEPQRLGDERGFFARTFCIEEFTARGLATAFVQQSMSFNARKGTLRGMHYQADPHEEIKLVRCTMGAVLDVILDLRESSRTFKKWVAVELSAANRRTLYIPQGVAHGFVTLADESELFYQMTEPYHADLARGVRWNDPAFGIDWPVSEPILSPRDRAFADFQGRA